MKISSSEVRVFKKYRTGPGYFTYSCNLKKFCSKSARLSESARYLQQKRVSQMPRYVRYRRNDDQPYLRTEPYMAHLDVSMTNFKTWKQ